MKVAEFVAELGFDFRGGGALRQFDSGLRKAEGRLTSFAAAAARWGAVAGAAFGAGMAALGKGVISTTAQFEGFETALTTLEGTAEKARASMDWIQKFAKRTPYDVAQVTESFIKLRAYGLDPMSGELETLGNAASAMNKPLEAAVEMFADASSFQFERLREFGIVASQAGDQVTFKWNRNGKELTKTVKKQGDEIRRFLLDNLGERFSGAMLRQSKTWNGMIANLGDAWQDFQLRIGRGGFFDAVKNRLADFLDYLGELDENGTLDRWSKNLSRGFTAAIDVMEIAFGRLWQIGEKIAKLFGSDSAIWGITAFAGALLLRAFPLAFGIALVVAGLEDLWSFFEGKTSMIGDFLKDWPILERDIRALGDAFGWLGEKLGPLSGYIVPVLGFSAAIALLAPAIRALSSALLTLSGIRLAWGVLAWLAGLAGIGKAAGAIGGLATAVGGVGGAAGTATGVGAGAAAAGAAGPIVGGVVAAAVAAYIIDRLAQSYRDQIGEGWFAQTGSKVDRPNFAGSSGASPREAQESSMLGWTRYRDSGDFGIDIDEIRASIANIDGHLASMSAEAVVRGTIGPITDARTDARDQSVRVSAPVTIKVEQASQAPAAAGNGIRGAIQTAVDSVQIQSEPAF